MKKLILATIASAVLVSPVLASDFNVAQTRILDRIAVYMDKYKDDASKMDFLTQKKECTEKATDIDGLKTCLAKFPLEQLSAMAE